jgi:hypothetical protein
MTALATPPKLQFLDANGAPLVGGKLYTYAAGTTTPLATYTDYGGGTANANPVILDSRGEASVWLGTALYKMALYSATDVLIWTVDNIGGFATLAQLAASGGSSLVGYLPAGTGAVATTVQAKLRESVSVADFTGFDPTGATDSTAAVQAAVTYIETLGRDAPVELLFPPGAIVDLKMVFITTGGIKLNGNGCTIVQNHDNVNSITVGGAGQYKVSNAFMIKRGAADVEITGFDFTTDDASFPALAAGFGSYFASIGGQHFDRLNIHHNRFRGGQRRALLLQAGEKLRFVANDLVNNGTTVHIGYLLNIYFYDGSSDTSTKYSPLDVIVADNIYDGYTSTDPAACLFLTGANRFSVRGNKLINMNQSASMRALYIYSNDFGPYDFDGTARSYIEGEVSGNQVYGTFDVGIEVSGNSTSATATWNNSYRMNIQVSNNIVRGTGNGIKIDKVRGTKVYSNYVTVSKSPLYIDSNMDEVAVTGNTLECTSSGQNATTVFGNWTAGATDLTFSGNKVVTPTGDQYAFRSTTNLIGLTMNDNVWDFNSTVASCRPLVLTLGGKSEVNGNTFDIDTSVAAVTVCVLGGNSNAGTLNMHGNYCVASGTGATTLRFANAFNLKEVRFTSNDSAGALVIEDCDRTYIRDNTINLPSGNTLRGIFCDNTGYAQKAVVQIHSNYVLQPAALNAPCIGIASNNDATNNTLSKVTMNRVEGNSTTVLVQQTTQGVIEVIGNTITNNGTGGTTIGVTGTATLVNL